MSFSKEAKESPEMEAEATHLENAERVTTLAYNDHEHEPELHWKTWFALISMCILQFVQLSALLGPPSAVSTASSIIRQHCRAKQNVDGVVGTDHGHRQ
jgi:hypothetical protein